jgi:hypothetical protein
MLRIFQTSKEQSTPGTAPFRGLGALDQLSVFLHVVERETGDVLDYIRLRHSVEFAVHNVHAVNNCSVKTLSI